MGMTACPAFSDLRMQSLFMPFCGNWTTRDDPKYEKRRRRCFYLSTPLLGDKFSSLLTRQFSRGERERERSPHEWSGGWAGNGETAAALVQP